VLISGPSRVNRRELRAQAEDGRDSCKDSKLSRLQLINCLIVGQSATTDKDGKEPQESKEPLPKKAENYSTFTWEEIKLSC
jgi:hypothetical protein